MFRLCPAFAVGRLVVVLARLISIPMNVNGAQIARAHGIPHMATSTVAERKVVTNGVKIMAQEKIK